MKKIFFYFLSVPLFGLVSCSNDDKSVPSKEQNNDVVPKIITYKREGTADVTQENTIVYNGKKIVSVSAPSFKNILKTVFTYTGDLITKTEDFDGDQLRYTVKYVYASGKLKEAFFFKEDRLVGQEFEYKNVYTHHANGTISYQSFKYDDLTTPVGEEYVMTYNNGNLVKVVMGTAPNYRDVYEYKYDNKNNPLKNITGLNLLLLNGSLITNHDQTFRDLGITDFGNNNVIQKKYNAESASGVVAITDNFIYTYDNKGFPLTKITGNSHIMNYTY